MAKQLYDYWFVQFDFPNEEGKPYKSSGGKMVWNTDLHMSIPHNWDTCHLRDYISKNNTGDWGYDTSAENRSIKVGCVRGADIVKLNDLPVRYIKDNNTSKLLSAWDIVVEVSGGSPTQATGRSALITPGVLKRNGSCLTCSNFCHAFTIKNYKASAYFYFMWRMFYDNNNMFNFEGKTSGIKNFMTETFLANKWLDIPNELIERFFNQIKILLEQIDKNIEENNTLTKQRDELLPLLMNGQVSVNYHLSASRRPHIKNLVIIMLAKTFITMKEQLIRDVVRQMSRHLDYKQQAILRETLNDALSGYNLVENDGNSQSAQENDALLDAFISAKSIEGCSDKTLRYYRSTISFLLADIGKTISAITTNDIRSYLANYQTEKQSSKVTIDNMRRIFSSFFAWLEDEDYILKSPVRRIHKVRTDSLIKEVFSDEHLELLRDSCTEIRDLAIIDLLASTGMRVGELVTLNRADVDMQERQCVVFGKGNKEREVYFNARTKIHLQQYLDTRRDDNPALFVSLHSPASRLTISGVEVRLRTLGANVNIGRVHPHKFRRTLATMAIDKGMPIEQVQKLLGHVKIDTTLHYAMVNQKNVKMAHRRFIS